MTTASILALSLSLSTASTPFLPVSGLRSELATIPTTSAFDALTDSAPFKMNHISQPVIPTRSIKLTDMGAVGDGKHLCTAQIQQAIDSLAALGGGHVNVPAGVWLTGPIMLRSHIDLHIEDGAIILFAADESLYPVIQQTFEGATTYRCQSPISGTCLTDVSITGSGVIDGNGNYWRPVKRVKVTDGMWKELQKIEGSKVIDGGYWVPSEGYLKGQRLQQSNALNTLTSKADWESIRRFLRPVMVSLSECKRLMLQGVTFQNSPAWNLHPLMCEDMIVDGITVRNPSYAQNGDGIDIESCRNVIVSNSKFDTGDDAICLKSGKDAEGRLRARPSENVIVDGCTVFHGHGGIVIGSEMSGGIYNVLAQNCQFVGTGAGIRIKACRGRGGVVRDITLRNLSMADIGGDAITADLYYGDKPEFTTDSLGNCINVTKAKPVDETTPEFRDIDIENIVCHGAHRAIFINGLPEKHISNIRLSNIHITADEGEEYYFCDNIIKDNIQITDK